MLSPLRLRLSLCALFLVVYVAGLSGVPAVSAGLWVKIRVSDTGMHSIPYSELKSLGFKSPDKVVVLGRGGVLTSMHFDGRLIFYGQNGWDISATEGNRPPSVVASPYSKYGYYMLTESEATELPVVPFDGAIGQVRSVHRHIDVVDCGEVSYKCMGTRRFDLPFQQSGGASYSFPGVEADGCEIFVKWMSDVAGDISVSLRGGEIVSSEGLSIASLREPRIVDARLECVLFGDSPVLEMNFSDMGKSGFSAVDMIAVEYDAGNGLCGRPQNTMYFKSLSAGEAVEVPDAVEVWDVTSMAGIKRCEVVDGYVTPEFRASPRRLVAFMPNGELLRPHILGAVVPRGILGGVSDVDMLIVSHPAYMDEASELAEIHRHYQNLNVKVVSDQQIYDEFYFGTISAEAIREYAGYVHGASSGRLAYLLLYGDGSYDNLGIVEKGDYLPTYQCPLDRYMFNEERSYCSDAYFGVVGKEVDGESLIFSEVDLAVGRLPVRSRAEASDINGKIRRHLAQPPHVWSEAVFISDAGDRQAHLRNSELLADRFCSSPGMTAHKVYADMSRWDSDGTASMARRELVGNLQSGCGYVHYIGHGTADGMTGVGLWGTSDVRACDYDASPIVYHSSCLNGRFDGCVSSIAEEMLFKPRGGAVACIMASRSTDAIYNQKMHLEFVERVNVSSKGSTLGQVWRSVQNKCTSDARSFNNFNYAINVRHYNLLGDPALPLFRPDYAVVADVVCGKDVAEGEDVDIHGRLDMHCVVEGVDGVKVSKFSGKAEVKVFLDDVVRMSLGQDGSTDAYGAVYSDVVLWEGVADVSDGEFSVSAVLPPIAGRRSFRVAFQAWSSPERVWASGGLTGLNYIDDEDRIDTDKTPPVIVFEHSGDGSGFIDASTSFKALILDSGSGLCTTDYVPGMGCRLILDGHRSLPFDIHQSGDGEWSLVHKFGRIDDGLHKMTLEVSDNAGNRASASTEFVVINRRMSVELAVADRAVRDIASFIWSHDYASNPRLSLLVNDLDGHTVYRKELSGDDGLFDWNLRGTDGEYVADGPYDCSLLATDGLNYASSPPIRIIVIR